MHLKRGTGVILLLADIKAQEHVQSVETAPQAPVVMVVTGQSVARQVFETVS